MDTNLARTSSAPLTLAETTAAHRRHDWAQLLSDPAVVFGIVVFLIVGISAIAAPVIAPQDPALQSLSDRLQAPTIFDGSTKHLLGTDNLGRDILSRLIYGARVSLIVAVVT
ncbi:MAG TPA: hypothetical protein VFV93_09275, partial [Thermomicrobiales bacterium]|nr:hypothetical protein [Thermomicrobiales bacterium]